MANIIFSRKDDPLSEPIVDGKITFSTNGDGQIYLDNGNERLPMGGTMMVDSVPSRDSKNPIQNKAVTNNFPQNTDIVNNLQSAVSVTEDSIPCGTKPIKELKTNVDNIESQLTANHVDFIFDYQNGKYGYNTDPNRGADTFHPFNSVDAGEFICKNVGTLYIDGDSGSCNVRSSLPDYNKYGAGDFILELTNTNVSRTDSDDGGARYVYPSQRNFYKTYSGGILNVYDLSYARLHVNGHDVGRVAFGAWFNVWVKLKKDK